MRCVFGCFRSGELIIESPETRRKCAESNAFNNALDVTDKTCGWAEDSCDSCMVQAMSGSGIILIVGFFLSKAWQISRNFRKSPKLSNSVDSKVMFILSIIWAFCCWCSFRFASTSFGSAFGVSFERGEHVIEFLFDKIFWSRYYWSWWTNHPWRILI